MIRNLTIGLLCGTSGVGIWAVTKTLGVEDPWPYVIGLSWSVLIAAATVFAFDDGEG